MISECCGVKIYEGTDICSRCLEHTGQENYKTKQLIINKKMKCLNLYARIVKQLNYFRKQQ